MQLTNNLRRGIRNKYMKGTPIIEVVIKDLKQLSLGISHYFKNGFKSKRIFIYPHFPSSGSTIYKISKELGYTISNKYPYKAQIAIYWEYLTYREEFGFLEDLSGKIKVVNLFSRDISKIYVDKAFKEVFGYSTIVDPLSYKGKCVKKNDINAKHDGVILNCPINKTEEGFIYQILIDNTCGENLVEDIRIPIVKNALDFVYLKRRSIHERFKNTTVNTTICEIINILNKDEIELVNAFCKLINLEYGELDVLRNKADNRIYIVDVNNTPQGPPANTSKPDKIWAIKQIASHFKKEWLKN